MHPEVFREFDRICAERRAGGAVLEVGATPDDDTLLCLPALRGAVALTGLNLGDPCRHRGFEILRGNANAMNLFADRSFDTVLCNATLEHDPRFWETLAEIRRVTKPGGLVVIGAPGFANRPQRAGLQLAAACARLPGLPRRARAALVARLASTPTLVPHEMPGDYYRFSPRAFREVVCAGLVEVEVVTLLVPPRIIGAGRVP